MQRIVHGRTANPLRGLQARFRSLRHARQGAAAVEFALVGLPFFTFIIGILSFGYMFYLQFALDYSLQQAVRQVQIGNVANSTSASTFITSVMCPIFSQFADCGGLQVSVQPVSDYWSSYATITSTSQPTAFCTGQPGTLMFARAAYQAPVWASFMAFTLPPSPASSGQNIVSAAAFANENPSGVTAVTAPGC